MTELRCNGGNENAKRLGGTELFISTLMSLFAVGAWGVRRRRRGRVRRPRVSSGSSRRRRGGCGCGCGCFVILILIPVIIGVIGFIFFRAEIIEIIYRLTGFRLRLP